MAGQNKYRSLSVGFISLLFLITGLIGGLFLASINGDFTQKKDNLTVPVNRIPAYHIIKAEEFTTKTLDNNTLPSNVIRDISPYMNDSGYYCTLEPLEADKPLSKDTLFNLQNLTAVDQAIVVGIPATLTTSLGGRLERGDVTDLIFPNLEGKEPLEIKNVQVLDVIGNISDNASGELTIIAVLPRKSALLLINETRENRVFAIKTLEV